MSERSWDLVLASPVGPLGVRVRDEQLVELAFLPPATPELAPAGPLARETARQLQAYFAAPGGSFDLPLAPAGTPFQRRVWDLLRQIPPGQTLSYGEAAALLGSGARAVGGACRANPLPILIPCHRVVAARGPGGYAGARHGDWLAIKAWLLGHEAGRGP